MSEEKKEQKEQKIDLKDRMLSDDDLGQVSGGAEVWDTCGHNCCNCPLTIYKWQCPHAYD